MEFLTIKLIVSSIIFIVRFLYLITAKPNNTKFIILDLLFLNDQRIRRIRLLSFPKHQVGNLAKQQVQFNSKRKLPLLVRRYACMTFYCHQLRRLQVDLRFSVQFKVETIIACT